MPAAVRFLIFDATGQSWPSVRLPQVAFAGRSNVGKSSLLNALAGQRGLARVSRTPGRTRGIALFEVDGTAAFADLPGYGFARVSRDERAAWRTLVEGYLSSCRFLRKVYILVDARRGPEEEERELATFLAAIGRGYGWVATKADKLSRAERAALPETFRGAPWLEGGGDPVLFSTKTGDGLHALWADVRAALRRTRAGEGAEKGAKLFP